MGNSPSNPSTSGKLSIVLDAPPSAAASGGAFVAGETLSGSLYAVSTSTVASPLDVMAYLSGKEKVCVRYTETEYHTDSKGDRTSRQVTRYRYAERRIVSVPIQLGHMVTGVVAGTRYRFPFQFRLPHDLPSTMHCTEHGGHTGRGGGGYCDVTYKVKAVLKGSGLFGTKKTEQQISVLSAPLPPQPLPHLVEPQTKKVNVCCCFNAGSITFGARIEDTSIGNGEAVGIDFACKNDSTQGIESAEAHITEEVRWSAGGHHNYCKRNVASQNFGQTERWATLDKREMKESRAKDRSGTESSRDRRQKMLRELHAAIWDGQNRAELRVPVSARHSHRGQLMSVDHALKIKVRTGSCVDNPKVKLPVRIGTPSRLAQSAAAGGGGAETEIPVAPGGLLPMPPATVPGLAEPEIPVAPSAPPYVPGAAVPAKPGAGGPMPPPTVPVVRPSAPPAEWADNGDTTPLVTATPVVVGTHVYVPGGKVTEEEGDGTTGHNDDEDDDDGDYDAAFVATTVQATVAPALPNLLKELEFAVNPVATVRDRAENEGWRRGVFGTLTPSGYASIIKAVPIEFDQPEVAAVLAPVVRGGNNFTAEYVVAALRCVSSWLRVTVVQKLLPFCTDLDGNSDKILLELTEWERICTQRDFDGAT